MTNTYTTPAQPTAFNFNISAASLLQFARMYRQLFLNDLEKFQELNPGLNKIYAADWLSAIVAAKNLDAVKTVLGIKRHNCSIYQLITSCRSSYKEIICYAQAAFDAMPVLNEFDRKHYLAVRTNTCAMAEFIDALYNNVIKYYIQFRSQGLSERSINELYTIKQLLSSEATKHQLRLIECLANAEEIISVHNLVYKFCQRVNRASKVVFMNDINKLQQYMLPGSENHMRDTGLTGVVTRKEDSFPLKRAFVTIPSFRLSTKTDEFGVFAFTRKIPAGRYTFQVSARNRKTVYTTADVIYGETTDTDIEMMKF